LTRIRLSDKSILAVPIRNQKDKIIAVLQLINCQTQPQCRAELARGSGETGAALHAATARHCSLACRQAAVALENSQLYDSIHRLFEGFVRASVSAIETRDPATSGHSFRVANLTVALVKRWTKMRAALYAGVRFSRDQMREIRYASLLHDFGK